MVGQDQYAIGLGYSHSQMDLEAFGKAREDPDGGGWLPTSYTKHKIEDYTTNMILARLDYGATQDMDVFLCLGFSDAKDEMSEDRATGSLGNEYSGLDCDFGFAWGLGTRATFWQEGDVSWGGLLQVLWENPDEGDIDVTPTDADPSRLTGDAEFDLWQVQIAAGPTVQMEGFCVYGGPFLHFVRGDLEASLSGTDSFTATNRIELSQDIRQESELGFYAGLQADASESISWYAEYRITADAWGVGIGAVRRFR
jgi:opacity protein-like surface antigen